MAFLIGMFLVIPALYAYSRGFEEIRYALFVLPVLIIAALFLVEKLNNYIKQDGLIVISLIVLIIISSVIYLDFRAIDSEYEKEVVDVARFVSNLPGKINDYGPESYYVEIIDLERKSFPILSTDIDFQKKVVNVSGSSIEEIVKNFQNKQVAYIGITEKNSFSNTLLEEIYAEKNSDFKKIYDSNDIHKKFKIKIFQIDTNE